MRDNWRSASEVWKWKQKFQNDEDNEYYHLLFHGSKNILEDNDNEKEIKMWNTMKENNKKWREERKMKMRKKWRIEKGYSTLFPLHNLLVWFHIKNHPAKKTKRE